MFPDTPDIALMAHGNIGIIAAQKDLCAFGDDVAFPVDTGIDGGLCAAVANGLDLLNGVRHFHQPHRAGEQLGLKVCPQAEAHHRHIEIVDDVAKLVDLFRGQELTLVHNDHIADALLGLFKKVIYVHLGRNDVHPCFQANAAAEDVCTVPGVGAGLDEPHIQVIFFGPFLKKRGFSKILQKTEKTQTISLD